MTTKPHNKRAGVRSWLSPGYRHLAVCPGCGLDVTTIALSHLAYTFEEVGDVLEEQLWHLLMCHNCRRKNIYNCRYI